MCHEEFWLKIWKIIAIVFVLTWISGMTSCQMTRYQIRKSMEAGVSPALAACAINSGNVSSGECALLSLAERDDEE